jgi:regulator of protease activity HflC (stomatin/prohibitin superfamily)
MAGVSAATAMAGLAVTFLGTSVGLHRVPEGHLAVYYRGGALLHTTKGPGFQLMYPFVTRVHYVQTTVQTDKVTDIPCGTSGGTVISFDRIEAVNQLRADMVYETVKNYTVDYDKTWIYDKIHHEINQICSRSTLEEMYITRFDTLDETLRDALQSDIDRHAPGISILAIRVTKPRIPPSIARHFEEIESEKTKLKVAEQTQRLVEKQAETERKKAVIEAEKLAAVEAVELERSLKHQHNQQLLATIENEMLSAKAKAEADAQLYRMAKEAEANKLRLTPELLQWEAVRALANNTKIFWGDKLPSLYADGAKLLG